MTPFITKVLSKYKVSSKAIKLTYEGDENEPLTIDVKKSGEETDAEKIDELRSDEHYAKMMDVVLTWIKNFEHPTEYDLEKEKILGVILVDAMNNLGISHIKIDKEGGTLHVDYFDPSRR
jgi:hypothetical protein